MNENWVRWDRRPQNIERAKQLRKECDANRNRYAVNKIKHQRQSEYINEIKKAGCKRCGAIDDLDFHHRDPITKKFRISLYRGKNATWTQLIEEIAKCDLLCKECHYKTYGGHA